MPGEIGDNTQRNLARRQFLKLAGATALTAAVGGSILKLGFPQNHVIAQNDDVPNASNEDLSRHQWAMVFDLRRCDGCGHCAEACSKMHYLSPGIAWIKVYEMKGALGQKYYLPRPCMQCENPPCLRVCPVHATYKTPDGVVLVDQNICIGCRMCMGACPYAARYFNFKDSPAVPSTVAKPRPEWPVPQLKGTVGKCVFCVHNTRMGKLPGCVEGCPMEAIYYGDLNTNLATNGKETVQLSNLIKDNDAVRLKEELNTKPRVYYIAGHAQNLDF